MKTVLTFQPFTEMLFLEYRMYLARRVYWYASVNFRLQQHYGAAVFFTEGITFSFLSDELHDMRSLQKETVSRAGYSASPSTYHVRRCMWKVLNDHLLNSSKLRSQPGSLILPSQGLVLSYQQTLHARSSWYSQTGASLQPRIGVTVHYHA